MDILLGVLMVPNARPKSVPTNSVAGPLNAGENGSHEGGPSYSFGHRLYRVVWTLAWVFLCRWTPAPMHSWRRFILRLFGAQIACTSHVYGSARIWYPKNLEMKDFSALAPAVNCYNMGKVTIGAHGTVSQGAFLCGGSHDTDDSHFQLRVAPIIIGDYAWVAAEAFVGPGVTLGEGAVIGARGVIFKDINAWEIWGGNPASFIRNRDKNLVRQ